MIEQDDLDLWKDNSVTKAVFQLFGEMTAQNKELVTNAFLEGSVDHEALVEGRGSFRGFQEAFGFLSNITAEDLNAKEQNNANITG